MVLDFILVLILSNLSNPLFYLFRNFIFKKFFIFELDILVGRIILMDKQWYFLDKNGKLVL